jgi:hypothetical protein
MSFPRLLAIALSTLWAAATASAQTYILATPDVTLNSDTWALGSGNLSEFRAAITNPAYFGPAGTVSTTITVNQLSSITALTLAGANGFMVPWWNNSQSAAYTSIVTTAFLGGMDLWLLEDDPGHAGIGAALSIYSATGGTSVQSDGTVSNGTAPFFSGPFGTAVNTATNGYHAQFDEATILALHGTVIGRNTSGQVTAAYWAKNAFAAGSGALVLFSDVDMISNAYQTNLYGTNLAPNAILALNTTAALVQAVPEPGTYALLGLGGLLLLAWSRRR